jgi:glucose-1-phosphate adenylyltransferase
MPQREVIGVILAGGKGSRLWPLTQLRSKPAVPIAGRFRLIDIPISNCLHSEIRKIFVLTQFNSESLNRHLAQTYSMPAITMGFVQILAAQQTGGHFDWYQGSADAVRQNLAYLWNKNTEYYVILSGDQLYRMDYQKLLAFHIEKKADITISGYPIAAWQSHRFGIIKPDLNGQIVDYLEKPENSEEIRSRFGCAKAFQTAGLKTNHELLGSMGIFIFSKNVLFEILNNRADADFGSGIFPGILPENRYRFFTYYFDGYWEDIGTIATFFNAMIDLTRPQPKFDFYDSYQPIFTHPRFLPGVKLTNSYFDNSILCEGAIIKQAQVYDSIVGIRSIIREHTKLSRVVMMGADYYHTGADYEPTLTSHGQIGIGRNCVIEDAIIDKNAVIGNNVKILRGNRPEKLVDAGNYVIKDRIVIIPKNAQLPDDTEIV